MAISKTSVTRVLSHHIMGYNRYKAFLAETVNKSGETLKTHEVDSLKIALANMRGEIEKMEKYVNDYLTPISKRDE